MRISDWSSDVCSSDLERRRILVLLCYAAIEGRDAIAVEQHITALEAIKEDTEAAPWTAYMRGLYARDWLNLADIPSLLPKIAGSDPRWLLRRASLHCTV